MWATGNDDENSMNKYEKELLQLTLERKRIKLKNELKYIKIIDPEVGRNFEQNIIIVPEYATHCGSCKFS